MAAPTATDGTSRPAAPPPRRIAWVDGFKGLAILLVVVGHVLGGLDHGHLPAHTAAAWRAVYAWIYAFHMPAFFFAAGLFAEASLRRGLRAFTADKLATLLYPYVVWTLILTALHFGVQNYTNERATLATVTQMLLAPAARTWFLYVLLVMFLLFGMLRSLGVGHLPLLVLTLLAFAAGARWGAELPVLAVKLCQFSVYFAVGVWSANAVFRWTQPHHRRWFAAAAAAGFAVLTVLVALDWQAFPVGGIVAALAGTLGLVSMSAGWAAAGGLSFLSTWGRYSLPIYLLHGPASVAARIILQRLLHVESPLLCLAAGVAAGMLAPVAIAQACDRWGWTWVFQWPTRRGRGTTAGGATPPERRTVLVISQTFVPDPASVGQHMAEAAIELARRGSRVIALVSRRGYEDPSQVYPAHEILQGVEVYRLPLASFGKGSIPRRIVGAATFLLQVVIRGVLLRRVDAILVSTSPPMASLAALIIGAFRRAPVTYWAMDINPDQAIALGAFRPRSWTVRAFNLLNRGILRRAACVVTLDRFMAERLRAKADLGPRLAVMPPWPHEGVIEPVPHPINPFRKQHGLDGKFVLMYSGNLSMAHPLDTILATALRMQNRPDVQFVFIGGGHARAQVADFIATHRPANVRLLPYQPLDQIRYSLSAADVHLVTLGEAMVGIVHPCKVYGAMATGRPCVLLGPRQSHIGEILERFDVGWQIEHGDVDGFVALIDRLLAQGAPPLLEKGQRARQVIAEEFSQARLCGAFCDAIEATMGRGDEAPGSRPLHAAGEGPGEGNGPAAAPAVAAARSPSISS